MWRFAGTINFKSVGQFCPPPGSNRVNIYINHLFYAVENSSICNFADDTTPYSCGYKVSEVLKALKMIAQH